MTPPLAGSRKTAATALQCGTDEAGYGPNLGPLVVAATAWSVPSVALESDLYERLTAAVAPRPAARDERCVICDSKLLYSGPRGFPALEASALALCCAAGLPVINLHALAQNLCPGWPAHCAGLPWMQADLRLPLAADPATVAAQAVRLDQVCRRSGVRLAMLRAAVLQPAEFNARVRAADSKGAVLTETTFALLAAIGAARSGVRMRIYCDQHGGRRRYAGPLQAAFPDALVRVVEESAAGSAYAWSAGGGEARLSVSPRSERFLPVAAASLIAKYLRELSMHSWNAWWQARLLGLRPTAGYPVDARRFKAEIAELQEELQIPDALLWRER